MPALASLPSSLDLGLESCAEGIWPEEPTGTGIVPRKSRLAPLMLAATTLGAVQFVPPLLATPSTWTAYYEPGPGRGSRLAVTLPRSASVSLARIRANLSLTVTELARILKVERPTIYAWMRDDRVTLRAENRRRLDRLHSLARRWESLSNLPVGGLVREVNDAGESVASLLDADRYDEATEVLGALAERAKQAPLRRVPSVRDSLENHGLVARVRRGQEEIDRASR